jgi:ketosteroid isomerase-like protein
MKNVAVVQELYRAFREQDEAAFRRTVTDDVEWIQCEGFPGGGVRRGPDQVWEGVFRANRERWNGFAFEIERSLDAGDAVVVLGRYSGRAASTGRPMSAAAAHVYELVGGRVRRIRMFADTAPMQDALR